MKNKRRASTSHVWSIELGNRGAFLKRRNILSNLVLETAVGTHHGWTWCSVISWWCRSRNIAHTFPGTVNSAGSHSRRHFACRWAYQGQAWKNDGCNPVSYGFISSWFRQLLSFIAELSKAKPCWSLFSGRRTEQNQTEQNQYREKIFWNSSVFVRYQFFTIRPTCTGTTTTTNAHHHHHQHHPRNRDNGNKMRLEPQGMFPIILFVLLY